MTAHGTLERRRHHRNSLVRPCKVRDLRGLHFCPGQTTDVSFSGALLKVGRDRLFGPGDQLDVAVGWTDSAVLPSERMVRAVVRRVLPIDYHTQAIAVEFQDVPGVALAA